MKLEEGMYVRTKKSGIIFKYYPCRNNEYDEELNIYSEWDDDGRNYDCYTIANASHNIIDLIGVGDFVNGMRIVAKDSDNRLYVAEDLGQPYDREFYNGCFEYTLLDERYKIKSIVTKEQFDSMKYEVDSNE